MSGYIGTQPVPQATQTRDSFTATSGQTSFATSGYTPEFLDVFLNGVKLAASDYTATNGSDVVLASGAATGDILEVVAYTAFDTANVTGATNFTVTGAFTSQGIDDNGNATALTIDSSENVMLGTSTPTLYNVSSGTGLSYRNGIALDIARQNTGRSQPLINLNLTGADGDHLLFYKDGASIGNIGNISDDLIIYSTATNHSGLRFGQGYIFPVDNTGNTSDGVQDLGLSVGRYKDAYLSGGVYLGGTGSANKLDDFEYGTWTPSLINAPSGISIAGTTIHNNYTKIGNFVFVTGYIELNTGSSSGNAIHIGGLPFSPRSVNAVAGSLINRYASSDTYAPFLGNSSQIEFYKINNTGNWNKLTYSNVGNPFSVHFTINYQT